MTGSTSAANWGSLTLTKCPGRITVVAILTVRRLAIDQFRAFESHASQVMNKYGGRIERAIAVQPDELAEMVKEVHIVTFPTEEAFTAYRRDEDLAQAADLRNQSVVHTELLVGVDGPVSTSFPEPPARHQPPASPYIAWVEPQAAAFVDVLRRRSSTMPSEKTPAKRGW